ncbi:MAG: histidine--tRNA ligase, partial [bacterium]
ILLGKYGEEAERLFYKLDHEKEDLALRYDLTVPLARSAAMYSNDLPTPFKRYQIQEVWRAERAQPRQGRFREFLQCDADTIGTDSLVADAEIIALSVDILHELGFPNAVTKLNHRQLLRGLMEVSGFPAESEMDVCRIIDKMDKIGEAGVRKELNSEGFDDSKVDELFAVILAEEDGEALLERVEGKWGSNGRIAKGIADLQRILALTASFGTPQTNLKIDLALSRGLDYYTGTIFESVVPEQPHIGSLTGGGRYDDLIGLFSKQEIPAVGITIGLDRILAALIDAEKIEKKKSPAVILITIFDDNMIGKSIELARKLREHGIPTDIYLEPRKLGQQFAYADKLGVPFVAIMGQNEVVKGVVGLKDMVSGDQREVTFDELVETLKSA